MHILPDLNIEAKDLKNKRAFAKSFPQKLRLKTRKKLLEWNTAFAWTGTDGRRGLLGIVYLFPYKAIRNQVHWLLILQVPGAGVGSLAHEQAHSIQLAHAVLQAGSHVQGCVAVVSLGTTKQLHEGKVGA